MIVFRADGNNRIGIGHIMRCLSVADAFKRCGEECLFVVAESEAGKLINSRGYNCEVLFSNPFELENETEQLLNILKKFDVKAVVVDSYYVTEKYLCELTNKYYTVYIDDLYAFPYPVNCIINYVLGASEKRYKALYQNGEMPKLLIGTDFIPLRNEFSKIVPKVLDDKIKSIFVSTGGADTEHIALNLINYIKNTNAYGGYVFKFVIGAANTDKNKIKDSAKDAENIELYSDITEMGEFMLSCDAAISAAGSTLYELCACGLPIVTYTVADNQYDNEQAFVKNGIAVSAGDARNNPLFAKTLLEKADETFSDMQKCKAMAVSACSIVDGQGAERIAKVLL